MRLGARIEEGNTPINQKTLGYFPERGNLKVFPWSQENLEAAEI